MTIISIQYNYKTLQYDNEYKMFFLVFRKNFEKNAVSTALEPKFE